VGTSYCDSGDPNAKWVWGRYTTSGGYYEAVIQRNILVGSTHRFKIKNYSGGNWRVYIDGSTKVSLFGYGAGSASNSADVGLEVSPSRMASTQSYTYEDYLVAWSTFANVDFWSGMDACADTDSAIYPKWILAYRWRHTLNVNATQSSC